VTEDLIDFRAELLRTALREKGSLTLALREAQRAWSWVTGEAAQETAQESAPAPASKPTVAGLVESGVVKPLASLAGPSAAAPVDQDAAAEIRADDSRPVKSRAVSAAEPEPEPEPELEPESEPEAPEEDAVGTPAQPAPGSDPGRLREDEPDDDDERMLEAVFAAIARKPDRTAREIAAELDLHPDTVKALAFRLKQQGRVGSHANGRRGLTYTPAPAPAAEADAEAASDGAGGDARRAALAPPAQGLKTRIAGPRAAGIGR